MQELRGKVRAYLRRHRLLRPGDRIGVAVSGGADSVALLRMMLDLRDDLGIVPSIVHFNHNLRGAESDGDAAFVAELAARHGLELHCQSGDVADHGAVRSLSLEAAARELRYAFFFQLLEDGKLSRIASGHTLDDQAETVLMRLARGAGTRGLSGIYPEISHQHSALGIRPDKAVIRPLLGVRRAELVSYLRTIDQGWREDSSNLNLQFTRNRVRRSVLPILEKELNPSIHEALADSAEVARAEEDYWCEQVAAALPSVWQASELNLKAFSALPLAIQRRILRAAAGKLGIRLEFRQGEELLAVASGDTSSTEVPGGWHVSRQSGALTFRQTPPEDPCDYAYRLPVPGSVEVMELGTRLEAVLIEDSGGGYNPDNLLAAALLPAELQVRNWRAGDRFWPAHSKSPRKVKELLQDRHLRGAERKLWPVVASQDEIIWLRGFPVPRRLQTRVETGPVVVIREVES